MNQLDLNKNYLSNAINKFFIYSVSIIGIILIFNISLNIYYSINSKSNFEVKKIEKVKKESKKENIKEKELKEKLDLLEPAQKLIIDIFTLMIRILPLFIFGMTLMTYFNTMNSSSLIIGIIVGMITGFAGPILIRALTESIIRGGN